MKLKNILVLFLTVMFSLTAVQGQSKKINVEIAYEDGYNFFIANDLGRNGYYKQICCQLHWGKQHSSCDNGGRL